MNNIPEFIQRELIGPYGNDTLKKISEIIRYYHIYDNGARFEVEEVDGFIPSKVHSKLIKQLIDRQARFLFGKTPEFKVDCDKANCTNESLEKECQDYINKILIDNKFSSKLIKGARDCFIGGKVAIKLHVDNDGNIKIMFVPADGFVYETDIDDTDKLQQIIFFYTMKDDAERSKQKIWIQKYYMENGYCYLSEKITDGYGKTLEWEGTKENYKTLLTQIPATVVVNDGLSGDIDGESDVKTIMAEDSWYNKMRSANLDTMRKSMNQIIYFSGVRKDAYKSFINAPNAVWDLPADPTLDGTTPTVGTIENTFSYSDAFKDTLSEIKTNMYGVLGIPDISLESMKSIITSGKALKAIYWPLIERCEEKMTEWRPALEWLSKIIIHLAESYESVRKKYNFYPKNKEIKIIIENQYPLPEDENEERQIDMQEVSMQVRSKLSYIKKWGGSDKKGLTEDLAKQELNQIITEARALEDNYSGDM